MEIAKEACLAGSLAREQYLTEHGMKGVVVRLIIKCHQFGGPSFVLRNDFRQNILDMSSTTDQKVFFENEPPSHDEPVIYKRFECRVRVYFDTTKEGPFHVLRIGFMDPEKEPLLISDIPSCEKMFSFLSERLLDDIFFLF